MKVFLFFFLLAFPFIAFPQTGTDSLLQVASDDNLEDSLRIRAYNELFLSYEFQDPSLAYDCLKKAMALARKSGVTKNLGITFTHTGYYFEDIGNFPEAIRNYEFALAVYSQMNSAEGRANSYNQIGNILKYQSKYNDALEYYNVALEIYTRNALQKGIGSANNNLGMTYDAMGNNQKALEHYLIAEKIFLSLGDSYGLAAVTCNIGVIYQNTDQYDKAIPFFEKAIGYNQATGNLRWIAYNYNNLANSYHALSNIKKALYYNNRALEIRLQTGDKFGEASSLANIANIYNESDSVEKAMDFLARATEIFAAIGEKRFFFKSQTKMAEIFLKRGKVAQAESLILAVIDSCKSLSLYDRLSEAYLVYSYVLEKKGIYQTSLLYYRLYNNLADSIQAVNNDKTLSELQVRYETDKKEFQIKQQQAEITNQQLQNEKKGLQRNLLVVALGLMLVLSFFIFRSYRLKRKANILLIKYNQEILQKNEEIATQRDEIAAQRDLATNQRDIISRQQKDIKDSIQYAFQIQSALFPTDEDLRIILKDYFIFYRPRDIVSGDFYWVNKSGNKIIILASDCTGHGVPGAFMSMLGIAFLNEIVNKENITDPAQILNRLRENIILAMKQHGENIKQQDGMDSVAITIDRKAKTLEFAGANNPLYIVRSRQLAVGNSGEDCQLSTANRQLTEVKGDKMPVSIYTRMQPFTKQSFGIDEGDLLYIFSDGFADQFGGPEGKKFKYKALKELLMASSQQTMAVQKENLVKTFDNWIGENPQIDDVLIIGIKI